MTLFEGVRNTLSRLAIGNANASPSYNSNQQQIGKPPVYPAWNTATYIDAYNTNATVYTIISYLALRFGSIPRYTYEIEDNNAEKALKQLTKTKCSPVAMAKLFKKAYAPNSIAPVPDDTGKLTPEQSLAKITKNPNPWQGQDTYYAEAFMFEELCGENFIELQRGKVTDANGKFLADDVIRKMPVLAKLNRSPLHMQIVPSVQDVNIILKYRFEDKTGQWRDIPVANIIHWKKTNPNYDGTVGTHLRGLAPLSAGLKLLTQDNSSIDAAVSREQNQGAYGLLVNSSIANPTPEQATTIRSQIDTKINGTKNRGNIGFLGGSAYEYFNFGQTPNDMESLASSQQVFTRLCNLFGIPPAIFLTETSYENLQQAGKSLLTNKILPACCSLRDEENRVLLPSFGLDPAKYTTDIDVTLIQELAEDMTALSVQLTNSPFLTLNEKREATGNERIEDENFDKAYMPNNMVSVDDLNINDGLDSYSGVGNPDQSTGGLHEHTDTEAGATGNASNAAKR